MMKVSGLASAEFMEGGRLTAEAPSRMYGLTVGGQLHIGAYTYARGLHARCNTTIGRFCSIALGVIIGETNHFTNWLSTSPFQWDTPLMGKLLKQDVFQGFETVSQTPEQAAELDGGPVVIGSDVWIATRVQILRGITIGDGAIIAAGAVLTRDVEPYTIVGGVSAKVIRKRFDESTIKRLLALRWWDYEPQGLSGVDFSNVGTAIDEIERRRDDGLLVKLNPPVTTTTKPARLSKRPKRR